MKGCACFQLIGLDSDGENKDTIVGELYVELLVRFGNVLVSQLWCDD